MKLNKQIRKTILETQEQKEKFLIEQSLIKKRLEMITSNIKTTDDYNKFENYYNEHSRFKKVEHYSELWSRRRIYK